MARLEVVAPASVAQRPQKSAFCSCAAQLTTCHQTSNGTVDRRAALVGSLLASVALQWPAQAGGITQVFVAGASGKTGRKAVEYLVAQGLEVRAGVRNMEKAHASGLDSSPQVTLVNGDVTAGVESLAKAIGSAQAVVCATGYGGFDAGGFDAVDRKGTEDLVDAAKKQNVRSFVLMSSLLTNGRAKNQGLNPTFLALNVFGGVLDKKHEAEDYLRSSGLDWTIVRPGGLKTDPPKEVGNLVVRAEDQLFGLPGEPGRAISRETVAQVLAQAVLQPDKSRNKVFEIVSSKDAPEKAPEQWFS